jgi:glycosyltransferase involved in cell wall biosynthesis
MAIFEQITRSGSSGERRTSYSIVVPIFNERDNIDELYRRIVDAMHPVQRPYEIVFVNDGSHDGSDAVLERIARTDSRVVYVSLRRNFGQATALQAGIDHACGEVLISMDGDLQHDPYEIPLFLAKIDEGFDIVSGWRMRRCDNLFSRRLPSHAANWLLMKVSGVNLHDFGTTFKAYRREVLEDVRLYGDMHRFVPAICARLGATIAEVPIKNAPRLSGRSNYGLGRTFRVAMDLLTMRFMTAYLTRPLHFFGKWGTLIGLAGGAILGYLFVRKLIDFQFSLMQEHAPLIELGSLLVLVSLLLFATGLTAEFMVRIYFEGSRARTYAVKTAFREGRCISSRDHRIPLSGLRKDGTHHG